MHFAGYPAAVDELRELCDAHGLALIEDVAHAPVRATSTAASSARSGWPGAFCFFSNKVLPCGEGGLLATDDDDVAALARSLRSQGMTIGHVEPPHGPRPTPTTPSASASTTASTSRAPRCCSRG